MYKLMTKLMKVSVKSNRFNEISSSLLQNVVTWSIIHNTEACERLQIKTIKERGRFLKKSPLLIKECFFIVLHFSVFHKLAFQYGGLSITDVTKSCKGTILYRADSTPIKI